MVSVSQLIGVLLSILTTSEFNFLSSPVSSSAPPNRYSAIAQLRNSSRLKLYFAIVFEVEVEVMDDVEVQILLNKAKG